jgi:hypothetical protein
LMVYHVKAYYEAELNGLYKLPLPYLPFSIFSLHLSLFYWWLVKVFSTFLRFNYWLTIRYS